jgi:hypothetical protein
MIAVGTGAVNIWSDQLTEAEPSPMLPLVRPDSIHNTAPAQARGA